ncbi:MAG: DUF2490 domain-containing protein [Saprospiraceae bacterium]|nr:DUF2490 domain-containing protein [Saprospiraceae bacterium]
MKKLLILCFSLSFCFSLQAQDSETGNWIIYIGSKKINDKWNWHHEVQYRNYNFIGDLEQLLLRTGFGVNLTPGNNNLLLGYGYILSENYIAGTDDKLSIGEHRIFQQFITKQNFGRVSIQHRYRIEERWVENSDFKWRFRYFLALNIALNNKELVADTWYLSLYDEVFLNGQNAVFDRNRMYAALGYRVSPQLKVELGFMSQVFEKRSRGQLQIASFANF